MSQKEAVTVNILDREYRIACEPDERRQPAMRPLHDPMNRLPNLKKYL